MLKNEEYNGTEEIGLVTATPEHNDWLCADNIIKYIFLNRFLTILL